MREREGITCVTAILCLVGTIERVDLQYEESTTRPYQKRHGCTVHNNSSYMMIAHISLGD